MTSPSLLTIRLSDGAGRDRDSARRFAELAGAQAPDGLMLMADLDGEPVAAVDLHHGDPVADPARSTSTVLDLLRAYRWGLRTVVTVWGV